MRALELGAVDFVTKPKISIQSGMREYTELIADKIRAAAKARIKPRTLAPAKVAGALPQIRNPLTSSEKLIIIGASTGGTEAIREFLMQMPSDCPGILIAQHMPEGFTTSFARRLDALCKISVREAAGEERVLPGHAYIAPGHSQLRHPHRPGRSGQPPPAVGRCAVPFGSAGGRQERGRRDPHRHGQGRRARHARDEKCRGV
jgi:two-component system chemotaxis response regulator CheB